MTGATEDPKVSMVGTVERSGASYDERPAP